MSTNDNSASRRGRRADQGDNRGAGRQDRDDRWDQSSSRDRAPTDPYQDQRPRDSQPQRGGYSNFNRPAYPNQPQPTLPQPQGYYQEPAPRSDPARYVEPAAQAYTPPPPPYEPEPPHLSFPDSGRDDLFVPDQGAPAYGQNPYSSERASYPSDPYSQSRGQQPPLTPPSGRREEPQYIQRDGVASPADDYERNFPARKAQETQASRFFLPDDEPQKQRAAQPDRNYAAPPPPPQQQYVADAPQDYYDPHDADNWADENAFHEDDRGVGDRELVAHENELDEDFFADEDELENDHLPPPRRSRKMLIAAALAGALVVGGGGAYLYKSVKGAGGGEENATPFIRADNRPLKELPGNPGGKQFPNGEKTIYDRLTPDGQQIQAAAYAPPAPAAAPTAQPAAGNSLEERIDEALRKAQQASDAPQPVAPARGADQPTVVRSESYRPDGTRVDSNGRTTVTPTIVDMNAGLPPPFGASTQTVAPPQPQMAAPFHTAPVPSSPAPASRSASLTPAEPTATPTGGYWVSLKSANDEKAIQKDLTVLTDKYKSVLGDVQVTSKIADLGAKGVHYRAVAGPISSRQEALELCQKIKGVGGDKACFVYN